jgi:hypothetical protein
MCSIKSCNIYCFICFVETVIVCELCVKLKHIKYFFFLEKCKSIKTFLYILSVFCEVCCTVQEVVGGM